MRRDPSPALDLLALGRLVSRLRELRPDIVHTHTAKAGALGRLAARVAGVPVVIHTFHGHVFDGYFSAPMSRAVVNIERGLARISDAIVAISDRQRFDLVEKYRIAPKEKVHVVPLGLDLAKFLAVPGPNSDLRRELQIPDGAPVIASVGRLVPIKRYDLLLHAFEILQREKTNAHLVLAGDGEEKGNLAKLAARIPNVHLLGMRRDLPRIFGAADLFVLTSDNEGTPVAAIEALASGVRVVSTDVGGIRDFLTPDLGTLVPRGNVDALVTAIRSALELPRPTPAGRDRIAQRFSHIRLIEDITELYDGLLKHRPLRGPGPP